MKRSFRNVKLIQKCETYSEMCGGSDPVIVLLVMILKPKKVGIDHLVLRLKRFNTKQPLPV